MKTFRKCFVSAILIIFSISLQAQTFTSKGTVELGGDFSFSSRTETVPGYTFYPNNSSATLNTLIFDPYVGVMATEGFEIGFMPGIGTTSYAGSSATSLNLFLAPAYNINAGGKAYPYFEFLIGYNSISGGSTTQDGLGVGFSGGVKVTIGGNALFLFNIKYLHQSYNNFRYYDSITGTSFLGTETLNTILAGVGFRVFFPSKSVAK